MTRGRTIINYRTLSSDELRVKHQEALAKVRVWSDKAKRAQNEGRTLDARRCADKARDWSSRARQFEEKEKLIRPH